MSVLPSSAIALVGELIETFAFLLPNGTCAPPPEGSWEVVIAVDFAQIGTPLRGRVLLALTMAPGMEAARNILGLEAGEPVDPSRLREAAGELANILAGNLLPHLYGDGDGYDLAQPTALPLRRAVVDVCLDVGDGQLGVAVERA